MAAPENDTLADDPNVAALSAKSVRMRLFENRWVLLAALALMTFLMFSGAIGTVGYIFCTLFLVAVAAFAPRRSKRARILRARPAARMSVWPANQTKMFIDASLDPVVVLDGQALVRFSNKKFKDLFGPIPMGDPFTIRFRDPRVVEALQGVANANEAFSVPYKMKQPVERDFNMWITAIKSKRSEMNAEPMPDFVLVQFRDQTDFNRLDTLRSDFIANVSHELRTPIASLTGFIETLQGAAKDDPEARERFLAIMLEQAQRMTRLVNDLLSLGRIELRSHVLPETEADLVETIAHVTDSLEPLSTEINMQIVRELPSAPCVIAGDRDELVQLFQNIIENACKYGEGGDKVVVRLFEGAPPKTEAHELGAECYIIEVQDFGVGISKDHLPRLTERFFRADVEISRQKLGTGLGLALVKHIVARHRGAMEVNSELGEGSTFRVFLPKRNLPK